MENELEEAGLIDAPYYETLKPKKRKAFEMLASGATGKDVAIKLKMAEKTICTWRREPDFAQACFYRAEQLLRDDYPEMLAKSKEKAKDGDANHMRILTEYLNNLRRIHAETLSDKFEVRWKRSTPVAPN